MGWFYEAAKKELAKNAAEIASLRAENERLRAALTCVRESGCCVMVHNPERAPCTEENCRRVAIGNEQVAGEVK